MRMRRALVVGSILVAVALAAPAAPAQEEPEPEPEPAGEAPEQQEQQPLTQEGEAADAAAEPDSAGFTNRLYVAFGYGAGSSNDFNTSLTTDSARYASNRFEIDEQQLGMAHVGWKLPDGKGDFRLVFNGIEEDSYEFAAVGAQSALLPIPGDDSGGMVNPACDQAALRDALERGDIDAEQLNTSPGFVISPLGGQCLYGWWAVTVKDGKYVATRTPGTFNVEEDDANGNLGADPGEIRILEADRTIEGSAPENLQNTIVTWDALYGREFGGRRFSSRWWAGLRYFDYEGQLLQTGWLNAIDTAAAGKFFTDQAFIPVLGLAQDTTGWGPIGIWEVNFNFYNKGLVFYLQGQGAFTFNSLEVDSGTFSGVVVTTGATSLPPLRILETRDKSSWQVGLGFGTRVRMRNGLEFELGYDTRGYLDTVLIPTTITLPQSINQVVINDPVESVSALYSTQDFEVASWHGLVGFQF